MENFLFFLLGFFVLFLLEWISDQVFIRYLEANHNGYMKSGYPDAFNLPDSEAKARREFFVNKVIDDILLNRRLSDLENGKL